MFPEGDIADPKTNEATDGLAPLVLDSFLGATRAASYEFPPASEEDPRRETAGWDSHYASEAGYSRKGTLQAQSAEHWCSQKGTLQTQMSNKATDGLAPSVFDHFSGAVRANSRVFPPMSEEDPRRETAGSDSRRAPEAWCSRTETLQAQIPTRLLTLLSTTSQTEFCRSGSPYPIFHRVSFVVCRGRRVIFLHGAVYDDRSG